MSRSSRPMRHRISAHLEVKRRRLRPTFKTVGFTPLQNPHASLNMRQTRASRWKVFHQPEPLAQICPCSSRMRVLVFLTCQAGHQVSKGRYCTLMNQLARSNSPRSLGIFIPRRAVGLRRTRNLPCFRRGQEITGCLLRISS